MKIIYVKVLKNEELAKAKDYAFTCLWSVDCINVLCRLLCLVRKSAGQLRVDSGPVQS